MEPTIVLVNCTIPRSGSVSKGHTTVEADAITYETSVLLNLWNIERAY